MINLTNKADLDREDIKTTEEIIRQSYPERIKRDSELRASTCRLEQSKKSGINSEMAQMIRRDYYDEKFHNPTITLGHYFKKQRYKEIFFKGN